MQSKTTENLEHLLPTFVGKCSFSCCLPRLFVSTVLIFSIILITLYQNITLNVLSKPSNRLPTFDGIKYVIFVDQKIYCLCIHYMLLIHNAIFKVIKLLYLRVKMPFISEVINYSYHACRVVLQR